MQHSNKPALTLMPAHTVRTRSKPKKRLEWIPKRYQQLDAIKRDMRKAEQKKLEALKSFSYDA